MTPILLGAVGGLIVAGLVLILTAQVRFLAARRSQSVLAVLLLLLLAALLTPPRSATVGLVTLMSVTAAALVCWFAHTRAVEGKRWRPAPLILWWMLAILLSTWLAGYPMEADRATLSNRPMTTSGVITFGALFAAPMLLVALLHVRWTRTLWYLNKPAQTPTLRGRAASVHLHRSGKTRR